MTLFWGSDTCFCSFFVSNDFSTIEKIIQRCELHKDTVESILLKSVQELNKFYNNKLSNPTKEQIEDSIKEKFDEKMKTRRSNADN